MTLAEQYAEAIAAVVRRDAKLIEPLIGLAILEARMQALNEARYIALRNGEQKTANALEKVIDDGEED